MASRETLSESAHWAHILSDHVLNRMRRPYPSCFDVQAELADAALESTRDMPAIEWQLGGFVAGCLIQISILNITTTMLIHSYYFVVDGYSPIKLPDCCP